MITILTSKIKPEKREADDESEVRRVAHVLP